MTVFESKTALQKSAESVYSFLADFNNHRLLMPENISGWSSTKDTASFSIQNMGNLSLRISNRIENSSVIIVPASQVPFNLEIRWVVTEMSGGTTEAILTLSAELNMMMKMMASGPLKKFTDQQVVRLKELLQ